MNLENEDLVNTFVPFEIDELDKTTILEEKIFKHVLQVTDSVQRTRLLIELEQKAKELKVVNSFKKMFKAYQNEQIAKSKQAGSNTIQFTNPPISNLKCGRWQALDTGIKRMQLNNFESQIIEACSHPILPTERLVNVDNGIEKVKLSFYKDSTWKNIIVEKNTIASKNKIIQLANRGIEVNENNAKELITFLSDVMNLNANEIPINQGITHLGWVGNEFVPYTKDYKYDGDISFENIFKSLKEKGDYEAWKVRIKKLRKESKTLHFIIAASFASPLIEILHINPFIVHLWGKSGTGKTVALMIAMSIWGEPQVGKLVKNLNSTSVGLERISAFLKNIPFAGDELQSIKNRNTNFNELIYKLTQGEGKSRGTAEGGIESQSNWYCLFLTTGEEPITSDFSKEGVKNRVIEIEENKKLVENGNELVNFLLKNYGHAGKEFIEILPGSEKINEMYKEIYAQLVAEYKTTPKQINAIASVLLADKIISEKIFEDEPLEIKDVEHFFSKDVDETERVYNQIIDWFYKNINRFNDNELENKGEIWGNYTTYYANTDKGHEEIKVSELYIIPMVLNEFLATNNIDWNGIKNKFYDAGYLEKNNASKFTVLRRINGKVTRCIKILIK